MMRRTLQVMTLTLMTVLCMLAPYSQRTALAAFPSAGKGSVAPLADHLPADTVAYFGWAGAEPLKGAYDASNLKGVMEQSTLPQWVQDQITKALGEQQGGNAADAEDAKYLVQMAIKHPSAAAFLGLEMVPGKGPMPQAVLLMDGGTDAAAILEKVKGAMARNPAAPDAPAITARLVGTIVVLEIGHLTAEQEAAIDAKAGAKLLPGTLADVQDHSAVVMFADMPRAMELIDKAQTDASAGDREKYKEVMDALGLRGLTQLSYSGGFEGAQWSEKMFVGMGPHRTGLLSLLDSKAMPESTLKVVPKSATMVSVYRLDLAQLVTVFKEIAGKTAPASLKQMNGGIAQMNQGLGLDIEKDILGNMADTIVLYRLPAAEEVPFAGVISLHDGKAMAATLTALRDKVQEMGTGVTITPDMKGDASVWSVTLPNGQQVGVAVKGNNLVVAPWAGMDAVLEQFDGKTSVLDNAEYMAARKQFNNAKITSIDFGDLKATYAESAPALQMAAGLLGAKGIHLPDGAIPEAAAIEKYLTPGMEVSFVDERGWHMTGKTAFPGAGILTGQSAMGPTTAAMGVAILLPALGRARELANRTAEAANESGIAKACIVYSAENADKMPEHLAELVANGIISPKALVSKRSNTTPLVLTDEQKKAAEKDWHTIEKLVDEHCDFVYTGKGTHNTTDSSEILIYTKPTVPSRDGMNIAFYDAHVEWMRPNGWAQAFESSNVGRAQEKMPGIKLDEKGQPPAKLP